MAFQNNPNATASITVDTPVIVDPGAMVYSGPTVAGLVAPADCRMAQGTTAYPGHGSATFMRLMINTTSGTTAPFASGKKTFTLVPTGGFQFIVGREYKVSVWTAGYTTGGNSLYLGVSGVGESGASLVPHYSGGHLEKTYSFTATSTSHTLTMAVDFFSGSYQAVGLSDLKIETLPITTLTPKLNISDGDVTLDSGRYPYAVASIEVPLTTEDLQDRIKPGQRVSINATSAGHFEKVYRPWTEQRRNWHTNPRNGGTATGGLAPSNVAYTATSGAGSHSVSGEWQEITLTSLTASTASRFGIRRSSGLVVSGAGQTITVKATARGISTLPAGVRARVYLDITDGGTFRGTAQAFWTEDGEITATVTPNGPVTTMQFYVWLDSTAGAFSGSAKIGVTNALVEVGTSGDPFDGNSDNSEFQQTRWLGTTNASASVLETRSIERVDWVADAGLSADLTLRSREVSHDSKTITLELASDELLLSSWADVVDDSTPRTHEANLRNLVNYVLGKALPGTSLQPGTANADITATWAGTNLISNPAGGGSSLGWVAGSTGGTIAAIAGGRAANSWRIRVSNTAAGYTGGPFFTTAGTAGIRVTPGKNYTTTAWVRSNRAVSVRIGYQWVTDGSGSAPANHLGPTVTLVANEWTKLSTTARIPANVVRTGPFIYPASGSYAASSWIDLDEVMFFDTFEALPQFNGDTPDTALYDYAWDDEAFNSESTRKPLVDRPRELFTWEAGQSAWDFLEPLVASAGLRLFCDEKRKWWLIDPAAYTVPGRFSARPDNTVEGKDTIDVEDEDNGFTGVVAVFKWTDPDGTSRIQKDTAGVAGKVKVLEFDRQYPGPGIAAAHLTKINGQGRVQDVTTATDFSVRPGQEVQIDLPGTSPQLGTLISVRWEITNGLMQIGSAGLKETPEGAIDLLAGTIDGLTGTIDSL